MEICENDSQKRKEERRDRDELRVMTKEQFRNRDGTKTEYFLRNLIKEETKSNGPNQLSYESEHKDNNIIQLQSRPSRLVANSLSLSLSLWRFRKVLSDNLVIYKVIKNHLVGVLCIHMVHGSFSDKTFFYFLFFFEIGIISTGFCVLLYNLVLFSFMDIKYQHIVNWNNTNFLTYM